MRLLWFVCKPLPVTDEWGNKEVRGLVDGFRESTQAGHRRQHHGLWVALQEVHEKTRFQRCWVHKTPNVVNAMPKSYQRPVQLTCARLLVVITGTVLGSLAKKFHALQQAPKMSSQLSKTQMASLLARRQAQTFSTGFNSGLQGQQARQGEIVGHDAGI